MNTTTRDELREVPALPKSRLHPAGNSGKHIAHKMDSSCKSGNAARNTSSSFAIAWSIILLILFTFFSQYIAYYQPETIGGVSEWIRYPILTETFITWLPIVVTALILFIIGHIILIFYERYLIQETILIVLNLLVMATVLSLLFIFPFDFKAIPNTEIASVSHTFVRVALIGIAVMLAVGILVKVIRLIINLSLHKA